MPDYLVRYAHYHESFRLPELKSLAELHLVQLDVLHYSEYSPFAVIRLPDAESATKLASRAILVQSIYELWGEGQDYPGLYASVKVNAREEIPKYKHSSFKFEVDSFLGSRSSASQRQVINSFSWLAFQGPILLKAAEQQFVVFEEYPVRVHSRGPASISAVGGAEPAKLYFGRLLGHGSRDLIRKYSLKKRDYLSTTSMDAEMSLIMANMVHAKPGSLIYDPFVGTGSLNIACAHYGAAVLGSDIDPRTIRGKDGVSLKTNFQQYQISDHDLGSFVCDLVNTPLRGWSGRSATGNEVYRGEWLDGIVCDPPYGVREGLKTLGRWGEADKIHYLDSGLATHLLPDFVAPRKPYSFVAILDDLLSFAAAVLVPDGRLSFWMPTADDVEETLQIPMHQGLELIHISVQPFNKWSRRLITYRKRHAESCPASPTTSSTTMPSSTEEASTLPSLETLSIGTGANDLNPFRKRYFEGFRPMNEQADSTTSISDIAPTK